MTIDTDASSGATSIYLGAEAVQRKGQCHAMPCLLLKVKHIGYVSLILR